ncbi:RNA polymerase sigma factor [Nonomuraea sp. ATR24]|uniref:RNA polymerase sigma factor n=1 Tax=Nonomuraea sp. ATR24 TaxID=1676744 RepID=UPI0035BF7FEC
MTTFLDGEVADPERFAVLFDAHDEEIRRYIGRRLDPDVAEDLAAETFLIAFRRRDSFDAAKGGIRPWLYGVATKLIGRHRRAYGELTYDEVAAALGVAYGTAASRLSRARTKLRDALGVEV